MPLSTDDRQTDITENRNFPQLGWQTVRIRNQKVIQSTFSIILPNPGRMMSSLVFRLKGIITFWVEDAFESNISPMQLM